MKRVAKPKMECAPKVVVFRLRDAVKMLDEAKLPPALESVFGYLTRHQDLDRVRLFERIPERPISDALAKAGLELIERLVQTSLADPLEIEGETLEAHLGFHLEASLAEMRASFEADGFMVAIHGEELVSEYILPAQLRFVRPMWWKLRIDRQAGRSTYTFWDIDAGTLRLTCVPSPKASFLDDVCKREKARAPKIQKFGGRPFVCYAKDGSDASRIHYYITAHEKTGLVWSYSYGLDQLDDEDWASAIESGLKKEVPRVLESITFGAATASRTRTRTPGR